MTLSRLFTFVLVLIANASCKQNEISSTKKVRRLKIDDVIAVGDISSDSIFNGLIQFYDTATNQLVSETNYKNGKLNGKRIEYHLNGKIKNIGYYDNGKRTETVSTFDLKGQLIHKQDFYYDLRVGSDVEYKNDKPKKYYFTSFDNDDLFAIDYDTISNKGIKNINNDRFFFWHANDITTLTTRGERIENKEYFIYLLNPPGFSFEYSLCVINNKDSILRTEEKFNQEKIWANFIVDTTRLNIGERFTLRLTFERHTEQDMGEKGDMLKRL